MATASSWIGRTTLTTMLCEESANSP
jgi:hypothetical protein